MRIDVDRRRIDIEIQEIRRKSPVEQDVLVSEPYRAREQFVAYEPAIQVDELHIRLAARERGQAEPPRETEVLGLVAQFEHVRRELLAADPRDPQQPFRRRPRRRQRPDGLAVVHERERDLEARQREPLEHAQHVLELGLLRAQELAPRRHVVKELAHLDARARRVRRGRGGRCRRGARLDHPAAILAARPRGDREPRYRRDRGQRLAAEPQTPYALEILERGDLAGRMPFECETDFVRGNAAAVVADPDQRRAAMIELDLDARRVRVERVLHEFLDDRRRPLDDLAGGDLTDELVG